MDFLFVDTPVGIALLVVEVAICVAAVIYIPRGRKPTAAMAWLLLIFLIPILGILLYLLIGNFRLPARRRVAQHEATARISGDFPTTSDPGASQWLASVTHQNQKLTGFPTVGDSSATLLDDYQGSIDAMATAIDQAERYVHVESYIVAWDDTTRGFFRAMERAVERGVTVRLLADYVATRKIPGCKETFAELDRMGVQWSWMLPVRPLKGEYQRPDLRNHRKLVIVDGTVGFIGSQNLISRDYNSPKNIKRGLKWHELVARVEGPVVTQLDAVFHSDWLVETGEELTTDELLPPGTAGPQGELQCQTVPSGPAYEDEVNLRMFLALIYGASERIILTSPYFVPNEPMIYAITSARRRGVEVELFVSELGDQSLVYHAQRSYYERLLRSGVKIYLYPAPYILHSKHMSIDDDIAVIGSSNLDIRSFTLNAEVSLLVRSEAFVKDMREIEQKYRDAGRELTLEQWLAEPARVKFLDGVFRLSSALT